jgi:hypothetical protein
MFNLSIENHILQNLIVGFYRVIQINIYIEPLQ